jgi:hypothetical protein
MLNGDSSTQGQHDRWNLCPPPTVGTISAQYFEALDPQPRKDSTMTTILIIILILLLIGGLPVFPHSRSWGYGPSGIIGVVLVVLLILLLLGRI